MPIHIYNVSPCISMHGIMRSRVQCHGARAKKNLFSLREAYRKLAFMVAGLSGLDYGNWADEVWTRGRGSLGLACTLLDLLVVAWFSWSHLSSFGLTRPHLFYFVLTWSHLVSHVLTCSHLCLLFWLVFTCSHLVSLVLTFSHLSSLELTCSLLFSLILTCSHLV